MSSCDPDLIDRAINAYFRWAQSEGFVPDEPNRALTRIEGKTVIIENTCGVLARYRVRTRNGRTELSRVAR